MEIRWVRRFIGAVEEIKHGDMCEHTNQTKPLKHSHHVLPTLLMPDRHYSSLRFKMMTRILEDCRRLVKKQQLPPLLFVYHPSLECWTEHMFIYAWVENRGAVCSAMRLLKQNEFLTDFPRMKRLAQNKTVRCQCWPLSPANIWRNRVGGWGKSSMADLLRNYSAWYADETAVKYINKNTEIKNLTRQQLHSLLSV